MPCTGPSKDIAYLEGEKAFEKIMKLLESEYRVDNEEKNKEMIKNSPLYPIRLTSHWYESKRKLKEAVQEMIWAQSCVDF